MSGPVGPPTQPDASQSHGLRLDGGNICVTPRRPTRAVESRPVPCARPHRRKQLHQILGDHGKLSKRGPGVPIGQIHAHISCGGLHAVLGPSKRGLSPQLGSQPWTRQTGAPECCDKAHGETQAWALSEGSPTPQGQLGALRLVAWSPGGPGHDPSSASSSVYRSNFTPQGRTVLIFPHKNTRWAPRLPPREISEPVMRSPWKPGPERGARVCSLIFGAGGLGRARCAGLGCSLLRERAPPHAHGAGLQLTARSETFLALLGGAVAPQKMTFALDQGTCLWFGENRSGPSSAGIPAAVGSPAAQAEARVLSQCIGGRRQPRGRSSLPFSG